ncbi:MAG TPA: RpiB/LacA/LacB family sugar-phosphate isomerase [Candidatus Sulfotelmatobacter sp.]|nr:RpiB/LacA/LacB family sugar-phosphate isomerase [Candidatus Sulfotelmatobacter sp.]
MKIALTTDHAGFNDIEELKSFLSELGHEIEYFGPKQLIPGDDYPDYMFPAAKAVASGDCQVGIILGGSGQGEAMAANRVKGVRCAVFYGPHAPITAVDAEGDQVHDEYEILRLTREHNLANVLSLAGRFVSLGEMKRAITVWLDTPLGDVERHLRRIHKLDQDL